MTSTYQARQIYEKAIAIDGLNVSNWNSPAVYQSLRASGIMVAGKKYMYLRNDEEMMCGKQGQGGICIFKTGQALIMGTYNQDMSPANNTKEVGKMADYLKEVGY